MKPGLALAALGIVFGDIGTSVLYSLQTVFSMENHAVRPTHGDVMGIISMIFWSILLVVCVKSSYSLCVLTTTAKGASLP